jgi:putative transposase
VSTRKVDDLVKPLGADTGTSKSEVARICADLDAEVGAFRDRSLAGHAFPYVFLDATYGKARVNRRVVSQAVVIATRVRADGWREVLGFAAGDSEDGAFWTAFLRSLTACGLGGVQLVISDTHTRLKHAIATVISARPGNVAGSISCATCSPQCRRAPGDDRHGDPDDLRPAQG